MAVLYSLWSFGIFFLFWYLWTTKNLATLAETGHCIPSRENWGANLEVISVNHRPCRYKSLPIFLLPTSIQGCQMVCFQTKNPNLGKLLSALDWKMLIYFMGSWNILLRSGNFYGCLVHFVSTWYIFPGFGIMDQEKSGNPASTRTNVARLSFCYVF
jgi:hypothetical protein